MQLICSQDVLPEPGLCSLQVFNKALFSARCREISHPPPLLSPQNAPHIALGPHLRPPFLGVPSALCQTPGECSGGQGRAEVQPVAVSPAAHTHSLCAPTAAVPASPCFCSHRSRFLGCSSRPCGTERGSGGHRSARVSFSLWGAGSGAGAVLRGVIPVFPCPRLRLPPASAG